MDVGVVFPQTEIGPDPAPLLAFAERAETRGFAHLLAYDHVLGADAARYDDLPGPYDHTHGFHEPLTLYSYLAGQTDGLELVTGILILPQRQTALVAKQAAEVDRLSDGRLRLGVAVGWNPVEYEALGQDFHRRGRRLEEQVQVLRQLWTENPISFEGEFHAIPGAGLNPLPVQRPIPLWMGGNADPVLRRVARLADGWIPFAHPDDGTRERLERLHGYLEDADRDPGDLGLHGRVTYGDEAVDDLLEAIEAWEALGADHLSILTMGAGRSPEEHVAALDAIADGLSDAGVELRG